MSLSSKITELTNTVSDIRTSINNKGVPVTTADGFKNYPDAVRAINFQDYTDTALKPTIHGVNYYDYNGDLLYVYTPQEFLALSAHPSQPSHTGLVASGWNWDLSDAQTFVRNTCDCLNIGGLYDTSDGKTEIYFKLDAKEGENYYFALYFRAKRSSTTYSFLIDWGDGTTTERTSGINTSFTNLSNWHTYPRVNGTYCIKISVTNVIYTIGSTASYTTVFGYAYTQSRWKIVTLKKIHLGTDAQITCGSMSYWGHALEEISCPKVDYTNREKSINGNQFLQNFSLKGLVFPEGVTSFGNSAVITRAKCICLPKSAGTSIGNNTFDSSINVDSIIVAADCTSLGTYVFNACRNARRIFINGSLTTISNYCFNSCVNLIEVTIPNTVTTLGTSAFYECLSLKHLEFSDAITSVGQNCFNYCSSLKTIVFHSETPPTAGATPFGNCTSLEGIYVPYSADHSILDAYKTATNWSTYAAKIFELDENGNIPT